jgi:ubiquinone/menaquinone biosynthesis C-methylase UbiE
MSRQNLDCNMHDRTTNSAVTLDINSRERLFHDAWAATVDPRRVRVFETFSAATSPEPRWLLSRLGNLSGKNILDLGTGEGAAAVYFALAGALVTACDLSSALLEVVGSVADAYGVRVKRHNCSAEDLSAFADGSFDIVYAANLLHHVDIGRCLNEVKRVLKPGGLGAFCDPLAYNPLINIYRRMAYRVRTTDEHPLRRRDVDLFAQRFRQVETRFFWLTTQAIFMKFYLLDRIHPNMDRYWERVVTRERELRRIYEPLEKVDRVILKAFPLMRWMCWKVAVVVRK